MNDNTTNTMNNKTNKIVNPVIKKQITEAQTVLLKQADKLRSKWRKIVTGDERKRIRDLIKEKKESPKVIKLADKLLFTMGVLNISGAQYYILNEPHNFVHFYTVIMTILMIVRIPSFNFTNQEYFLFDFCYFTIMNSALYLTIMPFLITSKELWTLYHNVLYISTNGPLYWAIILWGNSLVFHDYDRMSSVYIHILPGMLFYSLQGDNFPMNLTTKDYIYSALFYIFWQIMYYLKTEIIDLDYLNSNPKKYTSLRWLSRDKKNSTTRSILSLCKKIKFFAADEEFNPHQFKTKFVFMLTQLSYTVGTYPFVHVLQTSKRINIYFIIFIFISAVYYGASYYIEVFSKRYNNKFLENKDDVKTVAKAAAEVAVELVKRRQRSELDLYSQLINDGDVEVIDSNGRKISRESLSRHQSLEGLIALGGRRRRGSAPPVITEINHNDHDDSNNTSIEGEMKVVNNNDIGLELLNDLPQKQQQIEPELENEFNEKINDIQLSPTDDDNDDDDLYDDTYDEDEIWVEDDEREWIEAATEVFVNEYADYNDNNDSDEASYSTSNSDNNDNKKND